MNILNTTAGKLAQATDSNSEDWMRVSNDLLDAADMPEDTDSQPVMLIVSEDGMIREYALGTDEAKVDEWNKCEAFSAALLDA